jgi:phosphatidylinositol-3-phosphatase
MPYLNQLAHQYANASNYYAVGHPSIPNYFMLTTGQKITTNDGFNRVVTSDNVVRHLLRAGLTWDSYAESIPFTGYSGQNVGSYIKHHNPFAYLSDVLDSGAQRGHLEGIRDLQEDLSAHVLPNFAFIAPNRCNDAHDCSLAASDRWLKEHLGPILADRDFASSGLLLIVFDESRSGDNSHCGGHVAVVAAGTHVKRGYVSKHLYQHQNLLRTALQALGVKSYPGAAANVASMSDLFQ